MQPLKAGKRYSENIGKILEIYMCCSFIGKDVGYSVT